MVRDKYGRCLSAFARYVPYASSALIIEAEACREGLIIVIHQRWSDCVFESDCVLFIVALGGLGLDFSAFS